MSQPQESTTTTDRRFEITQLDEVAAVVYVGQSPRITTAGLTRYVEQLETIARQQLADAKAEGESILRCLSEKRYH